MLNIAAGISAPSSYNIDKSLRFRASASAFLSRTPASASNRKTYTWSGWVKRGILSSGTRYTFFASSNGGANNLTSFSFDSDKIRLLSYNSTSKVLDRTSTPVYRDPSAWYHIVVAVDMTQATATNRQRVYVNGVEITAWTNTTTLSQNSDTWINFNQAHYIARDVDVSTYFDGYLADVNFIDGQALTPASFGETNALTGVWQPAPYTGSYGTNGFYLDFEDTSSVAALGTDDSGNGNTWTVNNVSLTAGVTYDSMTDVPTLTSATAANYAVLNPLDAPSGANIASGNLNATNLSTVWRTRVSTVHTSSGKYYAEVLGFTAAPFMFGIVGSNWRANIADSRFWLDPTGKAYYSADGNKYTNGSGSAYGATYTFGDVIGIALDLDAGTLEFYKNGVSQGVAFSGLSGGFQFAVACNANNSSLAINFGQRPFAYTPPTGFVALNTFNLPTATILKGNTVMDATIYTGDGTSPKTRTNAAGFQPDLVWIKSRSSAYSHNIFDSVRGAGAARSLQSDNTNSEATNASNTALYGYLSAFNSDGFSTTNGTGDIWVNQSGANYVAWQWQAGQGTTSSNTDGSITSTVSVNASAGFSVVTYTGTGANATVGHGLGVAPKMVIVKARASANVWRVGHSELTSWAYQFQLNDTAAQASNTAIFNSTAPTSTVFSVGTSVSTNENANGMVAYCWSEIDGFSKFGSYTGNGSADGTFVYLGFRPAFVMIKGKNVVSDWVMKDDQRANNYNPQNGNLYADLSNAEDTTASVNVDFLSNGFKLRGTYSGTNGAYTYIYMAFAENPFKNSLAR
jgi:hypothetical protein